VSQTLLRGLKLLETVDFHGPLSISALARELGVDKATASRMVTACESDGWLVRDEEGVRIGPRSALLGQGAVAGESLRAAEPLVHAICGVTGLFTQAVGLIGSHVVALATASPTGAAFAYGLRTRFPLWLTAAGKTVAAQLETAELTRLLPPEPWDYELALAQIAPASLIEPFTAMLGIAGAPPAASSAASSEAHPVTSRVSTRVQLDEQLTRIRRDGVFLDESELLPQTGCLAVPWPRPGLPAAMVCIATREVTVQRRLLIERVLRAASRPGASRETIVAAAAETASGIEI
jgi:DNA-binding IclR family transcriptional regulator